jgi:hypothetical protein
LRLEGSQSSHRHSSNMEMLRCDSRSVRQLVLAGMDCSRAAIYLRMQSIPRINSSCQVIVPFFARLP